MSLGRSGTIKAALATQQGERLFGLFAVAILAPLIALTAGLSLWRTDGLLVYTLDDPYIHLSVAESILSGGYGINVGEFASPSSSILYPFILSLALLLGLGDWSPLVVNVMAALAVAWLLAAVVWRHAVDPSRWSSILGAALCLPFLFAATNLVALSLTGMEHTLHMLASVSVIVGLAELRRDRPPSSLLLAGLFFAPLLRFEGVALSGAALLALLAIGHSRWFGILAAGLTAVFALYSGTMLYLGLPPLPSSALVKSDLSRAVFDLDLLYAAKTAFWNLQHSLANRAGVMFGATLALLLLALSWNAPESRWRHVPMIAVLTAALAAHAVAGRYGWFGRYEVYAIAMCLTALIIAFGEALRDRRGFMPPRVAAVVLLLTGLAAPYLEAWKGSPAASENIYAQHYQMRRFATEFFPKPVAVNDIGWVSYRNDRHVLDLWGLGSERARKTRVESGHSEAGLALLAEEAGSVYAMLYDSWFRGEIPAAWCRMATLYTPMVSSSSGQVAFYLIRPEYRLEMDAALAEFAADLPKVSRLARSDCGA